MNRKITLHTTKETPTHTRMAGAGNIDKWIEQLTNCERIKEQEVKELCNKAKEILNLEENLVKVEAPVTVIFIIKPPSISSIE